MKSCKYCVEPLDKFGFCFDCDSTAEIVILHDKSHKCLGCKNPTTNRYRCNPCLRNLAADGAMYVDLNEMFNSNFRGKVGLSG